MNWEAEKDMKRDVEENSEMYEALADTTNTTIEEEAQNFVEAAQNNEYAEYELGDGFTIITDWEGNGDFLPYVVLPDGYEDEVTLLESLQEEAGDFLHCDDLEIAGQNHLTFAHIHGAELVA